MNVLNVQVHSEVMTVLNHLAHSKETIPEDMCMYYC